MAQVIKFPDIALQHRRILLLVSLLYFLLLPTQLRAVTYVDFIGDDPEKLPPYPALHEESSDDEHQVDTMQYQSVTPENPDPDSPAAESSRDLELAISLFTQAAKETPENFLISPDGLFRSLAPVLMGATGETRRLLQSYLGDRYSEPPPAAATATSSAFAQDDYFVSNTLLLSDDLVIKETYLEEAKQVNVDVRENIRFRDPASLEILADKLNELFSELTRGMVPKFCHASEWSTDTTLGLISSVYFKGLWRDSFSIREAGSFTLPDDDKDDDKRVLLDKWMLGEISSSQYAEHNYWQAVTVPYRGAHQMILVLPPEGIMPHEISAGTVMALFSSLDSQGLYPYQSSSKITIGLPPFKVDSDIELSRFLRKTPLGAVFTGAVLRSSLELGAMLSDPRGASINLVRQHCAIEVNKDGTRAAAVTRISTTRGGGGGSHRKSIQFNRPFAYFVRDEKTGEILFVGQVVDPRSTSKSGTGSH
ncbi:serpin family protein [Endozoicomonas sp. 8E]|uniref:serpin family protein n=1 Tax=Endozoicomonas sp. 8E TaxID=3035692 RepID=UPI002938D060|nr:serpin family protein [Endozoicomonas sp. 8E]WOG25606.1 serpin family protein [Endozoicomonas sp. 8E]